MEIGFGFSEPDRIPQVVAEQIKKFLVDTFIGLESTLYKSTTNKERLTESSFRYSIASMAIAYMNIVYKSLILSDDIHLLMIFRPVSQTLKHSEICVLSMLCGYINEVLESFDRSLLNWSSYNEYMESVNFIMMSSPILEIIESLEKVLSAHFQMNYCAGENIRDQDPSKPLFVPIEK